MKWEIFIVILLSVKDKTGSTELNRNSSYDESSNGLPDKNQTGDGRIYGLLEDNSSDNGPVYGLWDEEISELRKNQLNRSDKYNLPVDRRNKNTTHVYVYLFLRSINDFDEVSGHLESTVLIQTHWNDPRLSWDPADYNGFNDSVTFNLKEIWVPHIMLWNPVEDFTILDSSNDHLLVNAYSSGDSFYLIGSKLKTHCVPNVKYFPFDKHICTIELILYESLYFNGKIFLQPVEAKNNFGFGENPEWIVRSRKPKQENFLDVGITVAKYGLTLQRRPLFLLINLIAPIFLLSLINVCVFAIPIESGERTSFAITVFLALAVYMTVVTDNIPHSSYPMPIWSYFLLFKLIYSAFIALCSTIIMRVSNKCTEVPGAMAKIVQAWNAYLRCKKKSSFKKERELESHKNKMIAERVDVLEKLEVEDDDMDIDQIPVSWKNVAYVLDKLFMIMFLLVAVLEIIFTFILTVHP